ncbi:MAG: PIG-L family deacetylase [Caldilineaceae bacterium]|nr:PIG-L family deacetylase [Caldilineaceae bacterium]
MYSLNMHVSQQTPRRLLCLGAHSDDIEIGCGGTILKLVEQLPQLAVHWVVLSSDPARRREATESAAAFLAGAGQQSIVVKDFRDGFFPYVGGQIKDFFETLKGVEPDLILTHRRDDAHQDHRLVAELTWNTFRDHLILEYEIPKYDGDLAAPNTFVHLDEGLCQRKVDNLMAHFATQRNKHWFTPSTFWGLMRLRGLESRAPGGYAEAFFGRKIVIA